MTGSPTSKRDRTRSALLVALQELLLESESGSVYVPQVVARAGVSQGTFYNYFDSLEAAVEGVGLTLMAERARLVDIVTAGVVDPVEVVALKTRQSLLLGGCVAGYGTLLFDRGIPVDRLVGGLYADLAQDITAGNDDGSFRVDDVAVAVSVASGAVIGASLALHRGRLTASAVGAVTESVLGLLGAEAARAHGAAIMTVDFPPARPLPLEPVARDRLAQRGGTTP